MLTYNPSFKATLDACTTKLDWSNAFNTGLGTTRRLRCFRDANASAPDPSATGVEFLNVGSTGALTITAGNITGLGTLSGVTIRQSVDLSTGAAVLRLEGNGNYVQGTLGLAGANTDFTFTANMTATSGIAVKQGTGVKAPVLLDSGTGPLSPVATTNKPYDWVLEDWSSGSAVVAGTVVFDQVLPNMVFDDPEMQASMGDVKTYQCSQSIILGNMEFGAVLSGVNKVVNSVDATEPVYEVLVLRKPIASNWPNYPSYSGWSATTTDTIGDKPFKVKLRRQDGTILHTYEMRDGLPINHPSLNQLQANLQTSPIRPFFHCAGALPWRSHRTKLHLSAKKYYPGLGDTRPLRPSATHDVDAANGASWFFDNANQADGYFNWYMLPKWPQVMPANGGLPADYPTADQYAGENYGGHASYTARYTGWGYEPGSVSGHDQYTAGGGVRFDRAVIPTWYALYMHDPTYIRPRNNDSIVDMKEAAEFGFYNLPNFFITNVKTGDGVPVAEVFNNQWSHCHTHYGPNDYYTAGGTAYSIPQFGSTKVLDKNGNLPWGGAALDSLHNYWAVHWAAIFDNSAMAILASKHRLFSSIMVQTGDVPDTKDPSGWFLVRNHAWRWMHLVAAWKISTDHPWGVSRSLIEQRWVNELNAVYTYVVQPTLDSTNPSYNLPKFKAFRNLGTATQGAGTVNGIDQTSMSSTSMTFYMAHVLQMMKVFGLWDVLRNKSAACKAALDFVIRCMDLCSVDYILDTNGYPYGVNYYGLVNKADGSIATNWVDWKNNVYPTTGPEDWVHETSGALTGPHYSTEPLRYQYVCMRRDWIKETDVPCARTNGISSAITKYEGYLQQVDAAVAAVSSTDYFTKMAKDFQNYYPIYAPIKPAA